ncbi:MAG: hypothetical protein JO113_07060 [Candidatus Eremiobacteraeota bacterium]|nr:hypothetical protein [Candidatus Eremiobacteraeota bacterium]
MHLRRYRALYAVAALATSSFYGCANGTPSAGAPRQDLFAQTNPLGITPVRHVKPGRSWIRPDAGKQWLIYANDASNGTVDIYNFRVKAGKLYGQITGLASPYGSCVDSGGNVYVVDSTTAKIYEYAHGGVSPIATASDEYGNPLGCSVDSTTGNVAVSNFSGPGSTGTGGVDVFAGGLGGSQTSYMNANLYHLYPPAYDPHGNLFVLATQYSGAIEFAELPAGQKKFTLLTGLTITFPGSVQWDGSYLAVTDQNYASSYTTMIYRVTVSGSQVSVVRQTHLTDHCYPHGYNWMVEVEPFISGTTPKQNTVVAGNLNCPTRYGFWSYSGGGNPARVIPPSIAPGVVYGQAVSPPSSGR